MKFFNYSFKKILVTPSTYITLIIAISIPWILAFNESAEFLLPVIIYFTMPLFVIFITYTAGQIFRDEVENQTMLSILSKPIKRSSLIFEGYFALIIWVFMGSLAISLLPGFVVSIREKASFLKPVLMTLALDLLGAIFSSIALVLSLVLKGKSSIGVMLGAFGSGFYLLFGFSMFMQIRYSNAQDINPNSIARKVGNKGVKSTTDEKNNNLIFTIEKNPNNAKELEELYNDIKALENKKAPYDFVKWFDPSMHWGSMFGAYTNEKGKIDSNSESSLLSRVFEAKEFKIINLSEIQNNNKFTFEIEQVKLVPLWYPFVLWTAIGSGLILLSLFKINKINIA